MARALETALILFTLAGCSTPPAPPAMECPPGHQGDARRAGRVRSRLEATPLGRDLLGRAPAFQICFGARRGDSAVTDQGVVLLEERLDDGEAAARLGHLVLHLAEGAVRFDDLSRPCEALVDEALAAEARAHAVELELRRALQVTAPRVTFPFEGDFWSAPPDRRVEVVQRALRAHPDGGDGLPGLAQAYRRRCARLRATRGAP